MKSAFTNGLTPAQDERLALLLEEMGESLQVIGKIQRHGLDSYNPLHGDGMPPRNREDLATELGHVLHAIDRLTLAGDVDVRAIHAAKVVKADRVGRWLHHQDEPVGADQDTTP